MFMSPNPRKPQLKLCTSFSNWKCPEQETKWNLWHWEWAACMKTHSHHWLRRNPPPVSFSGAPGSSKTNPHGHGDIQRWGSQYFAYCFPQLPKTSPKQPPVIPVNATSIESPAALQSANFPTGYYPFTGIFCLKRASSLSPHWPWDCAVDLEPGKPVPREWVSIIHSWTKSHGGVHWRGFEAGLHPFLYFSCCFQFFFMAKKDKDLRPCEKEN